MIGFGIKYILFKLITLEVFEWRSKINGWKLLQMSPNAWYKIQINDPKTAVTRRVKAVSDEFEKSVQSEVSRQLECLLH